MTTTDELSTKTTADATPEESFATRVKARRLAVSVIGLGQTGLPLGVALAAHGFAVTGLDSNRDHVARLVAGGAGVGEAEPETPGGVQAFTVTADEAVLVDCDVHLVCVPTPSGADGGANLTYVRSALATIARAAKPGMLVVLQSTVAPGTTRRLADELAEVTGLRLGEDLFVAHAPERIDPANRAGWNLHNTPKLVSGVTPGCARRAGLLLEQLVDTVVPVGSVEIAETAKVFENTFRLVNIALVNQLADICAALGIPVREVVNAAATKPFAFVAHSPGPGVGGECIAVDPLFLSATARELGLRASLVDEAVAAVRARPGQVVSRVRTLLGVTSLGAADAHIVLAGVSYKPDVADTRNAPAKAIADILLGEGARVRYADPHVERFVAAGGQVIPRVEWSRLGAETDLVVLVTAHREFVENPVPSGFPPLLDCCHMIEPGPGVHHL